MAAPLQTRARGRAAGVSNVVVARPRAHPGASSNVSSPRRRLTLTDSLSDSPRTKRGGDSALFDQAPGTGHFRHIPIDRIRPRTERPRRSLDADALDELAASIRAHGVLQPIRVRASGGGRYEIIAGERRWIAARQAGLGVVPALIAASDDQHAYVESLVENVQREDLNPLDRAHALRHLRVNLGLQSWEDVGRVVGITRQHVYNLLRITELPQHLQDDVRAGDLTEKHARALLLMRSDPEAQNELWEQIHGDALSGDAALEAAQAARAGAPATARREVRMAEQRRTVDAVPDDAVAEADLGDDERLVGDESHIAAIRAESHRVVDAVDLLLAVLAGASPHELLVARGRLEELQGRLTSLLTTPPASRERIPPVGLSSLAGNAGPATADEGWHSMVVPVGSNPAG
jgi:ParB family transcriptional regulator, chromosome partitioning protein